ncbi:MAG TPA: hypothetical protein VGM24_00175 [Puia sp.]
MHWKRLILFFSFGSFITIPSLNAQVAYSGIQPGQAKAVAGNHRVTLENQVLGLVFSDSNGRIAISSFQNKTTKEKLDFPETAPLFELRLKEGTRLSSADFVPDGKIVTEDISGNPASGVFAGRLKGKRIRASFKDEKLRLHIEWEAELRDGSNYVRQVLRFLPVDSVDFSRITLLSVPTSFGAHAVGVVDGSPMVKGTLFFAVEHPMSRIGEEGSALTVFLSRSIPLTAGNPFTLSSVWGVTPENQLRRGFLYYLERERANPYHQFLHYNSWFDLSYEDRVLNDSLCLDRIKVFADSLITRRKTPMDAFLFDDGWDDYRTIWQFNKGFPEGFSNVRKAAEKYHAGIGVWMSPWGGYDIRKTQRLEYGARQNPPFEINENGFSLAGPVYFKWFSQVVTDFIRKYHVSIFKFDGVGAGNGVSGVTGQYERDVESLIRLIGVIRKQKPDIFLSLTIGTWPSVYWLKYGDVIWRAGDDTGLQGKGTKRQQWMNYRDGQTYRNVVERAPLYPLNALMLHGLCIADHGLPGKLEMDNKQIADEIWSFFGTGTSLEEMYVNPHKLNTANWDCLRDAIAWVRSKAGILPDVHWIGGDPAKEEVYGWAAWSPRGGVISIRNPSDQKKIFKINTRAVFELPSGTPSRFNFYDARVKMNGKNKLVISNAASFDLELQPFEVKVLNALPEIK